MAKNVKPEERGKILTLFLLFFPTLIVMALGVAIDTPLVFLAISLLIGFLQFISIKVFLDAHYGE